MCEAVGSLRPVSLRVKTVFSFGLAASSTSSAAAGAAAAGADAAGMAISVMLRRVLSALTRSDASSNVSFSIWSTMPEILASTGAAAQILYEQNQDSLPGSLGNEYSYFPLFRRLLEIE